MIKLIALLVGLYINSSVAYDEVAYKRDVENAIKAFHGQTVLSRTDYINELPLCINDVGYDKPNDPGPGTTEQTCPEDQYPDKYKTAPTGDGSWVRINAFFKAVNKFNNRENIQKKDEHTLTLWSGISGRAKAEDFATKSQNAQVGVAGFDVGDPRYWTDTQIDALKFAFEKIDALKGSNDLSKEEGIMIGEFMCMWLIFNIDPDTPVRQYSSNGAYERARNAGREFMKKANVKGALLINSFFWNVEMLVLTRIADIKNKDVTVNVYQKGYTDAFVETGTDNLDDAGWNAAVNLFQAKDLLTAIKVIHRPQGIPQGHAMEHGIWPYLAPNPVVTNVKELIDKYNEVGSDTNGEVAVADKVTALGKGQLAKMIKFVKWTNKAVASQPIEGTPAPAYEEYRNRYLRVRRKSARHRLNRHEKKYRRGKYFNNEPQHHHRRAIFSRQRDY